MMKSRVEAEITARLMTIRAGMRGHPTRWMGTGRGLVCSDKPDDRSLDMAEGLKTHPF